MNEFPMMTIAFELNGKQTSVDIEPRELLIDVLRDHLDLTGTKRSCDVEVCGACTVLVDGLPISSCTTLAADMDGRKVLTIEGVAKDGQLDPIQQAFITHGALQCGFCTAGMVLAVKSLLALHPAPDEETVRHYLHGNVCRCTGYVKIIEAVMDLGQMQATQLERN